MRHAKTADLPVIATCAATTRELASIDDRANHLYLLDAMGLAISVGTGIAQPPGVPKSSGLWSSKAMDRF